VDNEHFDRLTTSLVGGITGRRALLRAVAGGAVALLAHEETSARGRKRCKTGQTRCQKTCVNTDTNSKHCGGCGIRCAKGERCLNGRCYSDDICPAHSEACPNFRRCGIEDSDCFCGSTTGGTTICFQDEDFCESPRPCQNNNDCKDGRVCIDSHACCPARNLPDVPRTCVLPCAHLTEANAPKGGNVRASQGGADGPGGARR
jgi:hypothetical protein